jgi:D-glycero-D-manno-heptose 1,7-bisphosphate phosphatase
MPLVLLDRDGVINQDSPTYIKTSAEWLPIPGSLAAIARLNESGRKVAICTNQAGVGRGVFTHEDLQEIHETLRLALSDANGHIDAIFCCTHVPEDHCRCRKPEPGMLIRAMREFGAVPEQTTFIGDSLRDVQASIAAQCTPVLVRTGNGAKDEPAAREIGVQRVFDDLTAAVDWIVRR